MRKRMRRIWWLVSVYEHATGDTITHLRIGHSGIEFRTAEGWCSRAALVRAIFCPRVQAA